MAAVGGAFLTGRMILPVRDMTRAAGRIGAQDLSQRLPAAGHDEFSELAATFNGLLERLEKAFEQQRRFTADASHELRTPLTAILANTSLTLAGPATLAESTQALQATQRAATRMNRIVQDLLGLARSDAGQVEMDLEPIPIRPLLEAAVEALAGSNHAPVHFDVPPEPLFIVGDDHALTRLFTNLLDNAARHTSPSGRITVTASRESSLVNVTVADTGEGIPPEHLPHVCERFYRVDPARARAGGGTGLGLAISQSIIEAHGGTLSLESQVAVGTRVCVTLSVAPATSIDNRNAKGRVSPAIAER